MQVGRFLPSECIRNFSWHTCFSLSFQMFCAGNHPLFIQVSVPFRTTTAAYILFSPCALQLLEREGLIHTAQSIRLTELPAAVLWHELLSISCFVRRPPLGDLKRKKKLKRIQIDSSRCTVSFTQINIDVMRSFFALSLAVGLHKKKLFSGTPHSMQRRRG